MHFKLEDIKMNFLIPDDNKFPWRLALLLILIVFLITVVLPYALFSQSLF